MKNRTGLGARPFRELRRSGNSSKVRLPLLVRGRRGVAGNRVVSCRGGALLRLKSRFSVLVGSSFGMAVPYVCLLTILGYLLLLRHESGGIRLVSDLQVVDL